MRKTLKLIINLLFFLVMNFPKYIKIVEVGPRDGLQNESFTINTKDKLQLVIALIESGISDIEVTSFSHPKLIPQLADAELLLDLIPWNNKISYSALVPNLKGFERARQTKLKEITVVISASESHNKANVNCTISESLESVKEIFKIAKTKEIKVRGEIAVSFGCPFEGEIPVKNLMSIVNNLYESGCQEIVLADTIGIANPRQVYKTFCLIKKNLPNLITAAHFHDTNKMALANILASIQTEVSIFDSSIGGIGGCPFAPGATGNVATENVVFMLNKMNIDTGIDIRQLMKSILLIEKLFKKNIDLIPELRKLKENLKET
ncbi:MAG: hydroxymethylglutaryl-CoA lyase [Actinobacteria bacterium]|nr:hydroxymethylglutaryl-CoA lyase [Actinomycetota bacterium]